MEKKNRGNNRNHSHHFKNHIDQYDFSIRLFTLIHQLFILINMNFEAYFSEVTNRLPLSTSLFFLSERLFLLINSLRFLLSTV